VDAQSLSGRRALVCGSTQGIGRAAAIELASRGAVVTLLARDEDALKRLRAELPGTGHTTRAADFHDNDAVSRAASAEVREGGAIHVLVNNTGGPPPGAIVDASPDSFLAAFRAHLINNQLLAQAVVPGMKARRFGRIVNIASAHGLTASLFKTAYVTAKHGLIGLSKTVALEVAEFGITSNTICPGYVKTPLVDAQIAGQAKAHGISEADVVRDVLLVHQARKEFVRVDELAALAVFLASDAAAAMTATAIAMDGGWTQH